MFEAKINIYKVIKMLAKIKYDEDFFKRPLDKKSQWYNLSRTKIDYRQISFDRMNRERPGLSDKLRINIPSFTSVAGDLSNNEPDKKIIFGVPDPKYNSGYFIVDNYPKIPSNYYTRYSELIKERPTEFWENDVIYAQRYNVYNWWWLDT